VFKWTLKGVLMPALPSSPLHFLSSLKKETNCWVNISKLSSFHSCQSIVSLNQVNYLSTYCRGNNNKLGLSEENWTFYCSVIKTKFMRNRTITFDLIRFFTTRETNRNLSYLL